MGQCLSSKAKDYEATDNDVAQTGDQNALPASQQQQQQQQQQHDNSAKPARQQNSSEIRPEVEQALRAAGYSNQSSHSNLQGIIALGSVRTSNSINLSQAMLGGGSRSVRGTPSKKGVGADLGMIMDDQGMLNPLVRGTAAHGHWRMRSMVTVSCMAMWERATP